MEHELWLTAFLNNVLGKPVGSLLGSLGIALESPDRPFANYFSMELLVALLIVILVTWLRGRLSADRPGKAQQMLEEVVDFLKTQGEDVIGHGAKQFVPLLFALTLFILLCNILGEIPYMATPTSAIEVTLGCALVAFTYYNFWGFRHHGPGGYVKTLLGPVWWLAPLMLIIEIISHLARVLSLSVRLYANMLAGESITQVWSTLVPVGAPAVFMLFHVFVALLQTFIFILLTMVYLSGAVSEGH